MQIQRSLLLTSCTWDNGNYESFRMIPLTQECPYVEAFYDPTIKVLVVLLKEKKERLTLVPRLDEYGNETKKNNRALIDRQRAEYYKEYYITRPEEVEQFIELFAYNADAFNYRKILDQQAA
jgi:hypothetical protein